MKTLVIVPTYNEKENISSLLSRVRSAASQCHILVVDDASPDGTGDIVEDLRRDDDHLHILHRTKKDGLGAAYREAMAWALTQNYEYIVQMDADGSHLPEQLPSLLDAVQKTHNAKTRLKNSPQYKGADVVIGSRWITGGSIVNWPFHRIVISRAGSFYARIMLGLPFSDITGGYRIFTASALKLISFQDVESQGYCFQIDMLKRAYQAGLQVAESPITFIEREYGVSKMSGRIIIEAMFRTTLWGAQRIFSFGKKT